MQKDTPEQVTQSGVSRTFVTSEGVETSNVLL